jgi:hypothetical protein
MSTDFKVYSFDEFENQENEETPENKESTVAQEYFVFFVRFSIPFSGKS